MNILVSECLMGERCRYDGASKPVENVIGLKEKYNLIPVCPEVMGGLKTPRSSAEICKNSVINEDGDDVTNEFLKGANETLSIAKQHNCKFAILKENSPSCGCGQIYDGTFSRKFTKGNGITAQLLLDNNIEVYNENNFMEIPFD